MTDEAYSFDVTKLSDEELQAIIDRPIPEWWERWREIGRRAMGVLPGVERINRFLDDCPDCGNDDFIQWLLLEPYSVPPPDPDRPRPDFPDGWQTDPAWWARAAEGPPVVDRQAERIRDLERQLAGALADLARARERSPASGDR